MRHKAEFDKWLGCEEKHCFVPMDFAEDSFDEGWKQGAKQSVALEFVIQYLYSVHGICDPEDEAAPYMPEELKAMAVEILKNR